MVRFWKICLRASQLFWGADTFLEIESSIKYENALLLDYKYGLACLLINLVLF